MALNFGLLGTGYFGKKYLRVLGEIRGIRLIDQGNTSKAKHIIRNPAIDCLIIATPPSTHFKLATEALETGKHVLLEKPMVLTVREAGRLRNFVRKSGKTFMVGHQYLYNDYLNYLREKIKKNFFGRILYFFSEHFYLGPIRSDVGCFWEAATHQLAIMDYLFGPARITRVGGMQLFFGDRSQNRKRRDDFSVAELRLDSGLFAVLVTSWFTPKKTRRFMIVGEKKMAIFDDCQLDEKLQIVTLSYPVNIEDFSRFLSVHKSDIITPKIEAREPLRNQVEYFIKCVREGRSPRTDIEHGVRITKQLDLIQKRIKNFNNV